MKKVLILVIIGVAMVLIGSAVFAGAFAATGFEVHDMSVSKTVSNSYDIDESFGKILINTTGTVINIKPTGDKARVELKERESQLHKVAVENGVLKIEQADGRRWYEYFPFFTKPMEITLYLPESSYEAIEVKDTTGSLTVGGELFFGDFKVKTSTADIDLTHISTDKIDISVSTGKVTLDSVYCSGTVTVSVSTGDLLIKESVCSDLVTTGDTGEVVLKSSVAAGSADIRRSTGDVRFNFFDAGTIKVKTSTGDVYGTILSGKTFSVKTSTGKTSVPKSTEGGSCEIVTATGDIRIEIAE